MAACTHGVTLADTTGATTYTTGSFTPAANDLLVVFFWYSGASVLNSVTDSQSLGWTQVLSEGGVPTLYCYVANALASNAGMTVSVNFDVNATGCLIQVVRISGMTRTGSSAVLQSAGQASQSSGTTPAPAFSSSALTGNPTLGCVANSTNPAGLTEPTGWTEQADSGYATPNTGLEYVTRDSGFTGTTITWGSTSASNYHDIIVELDTTSLGGPWPFHIDNYENSGHLSDLGGL